VVHVFFLERPWEIIPSALATTRPRKRAKYHTSLTGLCQWPVVEKNGFPAIALGLSRGVDPALSATLAVDALCGRCTWGRASSP